MKPNLVPMFAALALLCGVTTSFGADEEFVGKDEPTLPELKSPAQLRVASAKFLRANLIAQQVKQAPPKKSRKSTQRHKRHHRPTPVEAGRAPHPPGS